MPPSTIVLMESPNAFRIRKVANTGDRDRQHHRDRRPDIPEKEQNHQACKTKADGALADDVLDRRLPRRPIGRRPRSSSGPPGMSSKWAVALRTPLTMVIVLESPPCLKIGNIDRMLTVYADDVVRQLASRPRHVLYLRRGSRNCLRCVQRNAVDIVWRRHLAVCVDVVVFGSDAHVAGRQNEVRIVDGMHHIGHAHLRRLQLERIDIDHDLPIGSAIRLRDRRARYVCDLVADAELRQVLQLGLVHPGALESDQAHRKIRRVEAQHDRRQRSRRQTPQVGQCKVRDAAHRRVGIRARMKVNLD